MPEFGLNTVAAEFLNKGDGPSIIVLHLISICNILSTNYSLYLLLQFSLAPSPFIILYVNTVRSV